MTTKDKRRYQRTQCRHQVTLTFKDHFVFHGTTRDVCRAGASVELREHPSDIYFGDTGVFTTMTDQEPVVLRCELVWVKDDRIGIYFVDKPTDSALAVMCGSPYESDKQAANDEV